MRNVIFLDIDGILNEGPKKSLQPDKIRKLSELVLNTKSEIILHSGWRFWFDDSMSPLNDDAFNLMTMLQSEGLKLAGRTPDLKCIFHSCRSPFTVV